MEHHESDTSRLKRWGQRQRRTNSKCTIYIYIYMCGSHDTRYTGHILIDARLPLFSFPVSIMYRVAVPSIAKTRDTLERKSPKEPQPTNSTTVHRVRALRFVATTGVHTRWFFTASALKWRSK